MLALSGLAWLAIGLGVAFAIVTGLLVIALVIMCRYDPLLGPKHFFGDKD